MKKLSENSKIVIVIVLTVFLGISAVLIRLDLAMGKTFIPTKYIVLGASIVVIIFALFVLFASPKVFKNDKEQ